MHHDIVQVVVNLLFDTEGWPIPNLSIFWSHASLSPSSNHPILESQRVEQNLFCWAYFIFFAFDRL